MEHISIISNLYPPEVKGGYEILAEEFARFAQQHCQVSVLTTDCDKASSQEGVTRTLQPSSPWNEPPVYSRWPKIRSALFNYRKALQFFREEQPTRAFFWNLNRIGLGPVLAARRLGIPCYFTINDYYPLQYVEQRAGLERFKQMLLQSWSGLSDMSFTMISDYLKQDLADQGFAPQNTKVIYQGTDMTRFPLKPNPWKLPQPLRLLYVGTLSHDKGLDTLLASLVGLNVPYHLTLVGGGRPEYIEQLKDFATQNELMQNLTFVGPIPREQVPSYMHSHDVLVFPSRWPEPYGLSHLEAIASGMFVVCTAVGGVREFLQNDVFVETFEAGNANELQQCILRTQNYTSVEQEKAKQSTEWVRDYFHLPRYCNELLQFLDVSPALS